MKEFIVLTTAVFIVLVNSKIDRYCDLSCDYVTENVSHTVCDRENVATNLSSKFDNCRKWVSAQSRCQVITNFSWNLSCGPSEKCGPNFEILHLDDSTRQYVVNLHNYFRNKVAVGNESRNDQPSAANMMIMNYNHELENIAQCWANACNGNPLIHDHCRRTEEYEHVGQNLGVINSSVSDFDMKKTMKKLVTLWYDEVEIFKNEWINETDDRGPDFIVGHYTQMVWVDTSEIGCASSYYTSNSSNKTWHHLLLVCNYGPGGNYLGLPVYGVGEPCSNCPGNLQSNEKYEGLCGQSKYSPTENNTVDLETMQLELTENNSLDDV